MAKARGIKKLISEVAPVAIVADFFPQAIRCDHKKKKLFRNLVIHLLSVTCYPFVILVFCLAFKIQSDKYIYFLINQVNCIWIASQLEVHIFVLWQTATLI